MPSGIANPTRTVPGRTAVSRPTRSTTPSQSRGGPSDQTQLSRRSVLNERGRTSVPNFGAWAQQNEALSLKEGEFLKRGRGGMEPGKIKQMQELINSHGGHLKVDGDFGFRTERALRDFQKRNGLRSDGVVGPKTLEALQKAPAKKKPEASTGQRPSLDFGGNTLKKGGEGDHVRQLQEALNKQGANLEVDGKFGGQTEKAVRAFQRKRGLGVDGVVGPNTLAGLNGKKTTRVRRYGQAQGTQETQGTQGPASGNKLADYARKWDGRAFKPGQTKRCADFVSTMLRKSGAAPRGFRHTASAAGLARYGKYVNRSQLRPGDTVFFGNTYRKGKYTHVGIYIGGGKFVHRPTAARPVRVDSLSGYYAKKFTGGRRL